MGTNVVKEFFDDRDKSLGLFRGHITDIYRESDDLDGLSDSDDEESNDIVLYHVLYEDGDCEDMNELECRKGMDLYQKLESGEINEWEIGGDE